MNRHCLSLLFLTFLCTSVCAQRMLPFSAVPGMVDEVYENIRDHHPIGYESAGRERLLAARTQVQGFMSSARFADSIALWDFTRLVSPLQEVTDCGHLILEPHFDSLMNVRVRENVFPLSLMRTDDGRFILLKGLRTTTDSLLPTTAIAAINGEELGPMIKNMAYFAGLNDVGNVSATQAAIARGMGLQYQRHYGLQTSLTLTLTDGSRREILPTHRPWVDPKKKVTPIAETITFRYAEDGQTGILDINSFADRKFRDGNYYKFVKQVFDTLKQSGTRQLIIDLRDNTGGSSGRINYLYSFLSEGKFRFADRIVLTGPAKALPGESAKDLKRRRSGAVSKHGRKVQRVLSKAMKPRKANLRFDGEVVVLINEMTFSASGMFARFVQGSGRGKLLGVTAGASAGTTFGGSNRKKRLFIGPNEEFELKINNIALQLPYAIEGNVTPDIIVPITEDALREGRDEQLERALVLVEGKGLR